MKLFLVLIFYSVFLKSLATHGFGSKQHLQLLPANPLYQESRYMSHHLKLGTRKNLPRIILIKNLLELNCLKEFYHQNKFKNKKTSKIIPGLYEEAKLSSNVLQATFETGNDQLVDRKDIKIKNELKNDKKYLDNKKESVLIDTDENFNRLNTVPEKRHNQTEAEKNLVVKNTAENIKTGTVNEKLGNEHHTEKVHIFQAGEQVPSKPTIILGNAQQSFVAVENEDSDVSSSDGGKFFKLPLPFNRATKAPHAESTIENSWLQTRPSKVKPYEVEEILDESLNVNTSDAAENEKMKDSDIRTEVHSIPSEKDKKKTEDTTKKNLEDPLTGISNSFSAILQGLINPRIKPATTKQAGTKTTLRPFLQTLASGSEFTQNVKAGGSTNNTKSATGPFQNFGGFSNSFFKDRKQLNSSSPYPIHRTEGKPLRNPQKWFFNKNQRPNTPLGSINNRNDLRVPNFVQNQTKQLDELQRQYYEGTKAKNHSESPGYISQDQVHAARRMDEFLDTLFEVENSKEELIKENSTTKELKATRKSFSSDMETTKPQDESLIIMSSPSVLKDLSGPVGKQIDEYKVTTLKLSSTREVFTASPTAAEQTLTRFFTPKNYSVPATRSFSKSVRSLETSSPDFELTTFKEFNDDPMAFDLLTEEKQPTFEEANWKNSRKMHFSNGSPNVNVSNKTHETEQRRSDILISDVPEDYNVGGILDNASTNFSLLQVNGSRRFPNLLNDLTLDLLIQYIPTIIYHIREGKFSAEDSSVLSKIFGKHWSDILTLSNNTNIDILPLFKIQNEKDLESVLQSYKLKKSTGKIVNNNSINMSEDHTYDYLDEFKDLYQELGDEEIENQKLEVNSKVQNN